MRYAAGMNAAPHIPAKRTQSWARLVVRARWAACLAERTHAKRNGGIAQGIAFSLHASAKHAQSATGVVQDAATLLPAHLRRTRMRKTLCAERREESDPMQVTGRWTTRKAPSQSLACARSHARIRKPLFHLAFCKTPR